MIRNKIKINKKTGKIKEQECDLQASVEELLKIVLDGWFEHVIPNFYTKKNTGIPDIIGYKNVKTELGILQKFFYIELKIGDKKPTPDQIEYMNKLTLKGAIGCVAYNMEDVRIFLRDKLGIRID
jgi:hypothetical protein